MEDNKILEIILTKLDSIDSKLNNIEGRLDNIESVQSQHTKQLQIIKEQTARNAELESKHNSLAKDVELLQVDVKLIKRAITNN